MLGNTQQLLTVVMLYSYLQIACSPICKPSQLRPRFSKYGAAIQTYDTEVGKHGNAVSAIGWEFRNQSDLKLLSDVAGLGAYLSTCRCSLNEQYPLLTNLIQSLIRASEHYS
jgi:hypothetical protein